MDHTPLVFSPVQIALELAHTDVDLLIEGAVVVLVGPEVGNLGVTLDADLDGLPDDEEQQIGTDPFDPDTAGDGDGLPDGE